MAQIAAYLFPQKFICFVRVCVCTDILCLEDYAKMEQEEQLEREMKGNKRSCLSDMHQQLACGKKQNTNKKKQWKQCTKSHHNVLKRLTEQKVYIFKNYLHLYFPFLSFEGKRSTYF